MVYCAWRNLSVPVCRATERTGRANVLKLLVLDGNSIVNRAFYGIKVLTTKDGRYTNALVGFMNILLKLENDVQPDEVAIAFDLKAPTFRHLAYEGYKATRKGMPDDTHRCCLTPRTQQPPAGPQGKITVRNRGPGLPVPRVLQVPEPDSPRN